jgi:hypothetical protein
MKLDRIEVVAIVVVGVVLTLLGLAALLAWRF